MSKLSSPVKSPLSVTSQSTFQSQTSSSDQHCNDCNAKFTKVFKEYACSSCSKLYCVRCTVASFSSAGDGTIERSVRTCNPCLDQLQPEIHPLVAPKHKSFLKSRSRPEPAVSEAPFVAPPVSTSVWKIRGISPTRVLKGWGVGGPTPSLASPPPSPAKDTFANAVELAREREKEQTRHTFLKKTLRETPESPVKEKEKEKEKAKEKAKVREKELSPEKKKSPMKSAAKKMMSLQSKATSAFTAASVTAGKSMAAVVVQSMVQSKPSFIQSLFPSFFGGSRIAYSASETDAVPAAATAAAAAAASNKENNNSSGPVSGSPQTDIAPLHTSAEERNKLRAVTDRIRQYRKKEKEEEEEKEKEKEKKATERYATPPPIYPEAQQSPPPSSADVTAGTGSAVTNNFAQRIMDRMEAKRALKKAEREAAEEELARNKAKKDEAARVKAEKDRIAAVNAARIKAIEEEKESARVRAEEKEQEQARLTAEAEAARIRVIELEKEAARVKAEEVEQTRLAALAAARIKALEDEQARAVVEAARVRAEAAEQARVAAEAEEAARIEAARIEAEAEAEARAEENASIKAEDEEAARSKADRREAVKNRLKNLLQDDAIKNKRSINDDKREFNGFLGSCSSDLSSAFADAKLSLTVPAASQSPASPTSPSDLLLPASPVSPVDEENTVYYVDTKVLPSCVSVSTVASSIFSELRSNSGHQSNSPTRERIMRASKVHMSSPVLTPVISASGRIGAIRTITSVAAPGAASTPLPSTLEPPSSTTSNVSELTMTTPIKPTAVRPPPKPSLEEQSVSSERDDDRDADAMGAEDRSDDDGNGSDSSGYSPTHVRYLGTSEKRRRTTVANARTWQKQRRKQDAAQNVTAPATSPAPSSSSTSSSSSSSSSSFEFVEEAQRKKRNMRLVLNFAVVGVLLALLSANRGACDAFLRSMNFAALRRRYSGSGSSLSSLSSSLEKSNGLLGPRNATAVLKRMAGAAHADLEAALRAPGWTQLQSTPAYSLQVLTPEGRAGPAPLYVRTLHHLPGVSPEELHRSLADWESDWGWDDRAASANAESGQDKTALNSLLEALETLVRKLAGRGRQRAGRLAGGFGFGMADSVWDSRSAGRFGPAAGDTSEALLVSAPLWLGADWPLGSGGAASSSVVVALTEGRQSADLAAGAIRIPRSAHVSYELAVDGALLAGDWGSAARKFQADARAGLGAGVRQDSVAWLLEGPGGGALLLRVSRVRGLGRWAQWRYILNALLALPASARRLAQLG